MSPKLKITLPKVRVQRRKVRYVLFSLPLICVLAYVLASAYLLHRVIDPYDPREAINLTYVIAASLSPLAVFEYRWEWELSAMEAEVPEFLSALEGGIRGGLPLPQALAESLKYVKYLRKDLSKVVNALWAGETVEQAVKFMRKDSPILAILADYVLVLARSGEQLYKTIRDFRESVSSVVNYMKKLRESTKSFLATLYLIMFVYLITTAVFLTTFIYPLASQAVQGERALLTPIDPSALTTLIVYGALIEAVANGAVASYFMGSRYLAALIHSVVVLFVSLALYTVLVYTQLPQAALMP